MEKDKDTPRKKKIEILYFDLNQDYIDLDKISLRGRLIKGLAKIILKDDSSETESSSRRYTIKFEGRINADDLSEVEKSEIEQAMRDHYNEVCRDFIRKKRAKIYNKQVKKYFLRKEISKRLPTIVEYDTKTIPVGAFRHLMNNILNEKGVPIEEINKIAYGSAIWKNVLGEFMQERGYIKKKGKYVPIKK